MEEKSRNRPELDSFQLTRFEQRLASKEIHNEGIFSELGLNWEIGLEIFNNRDKSSH